MFAEVIVRIVFGTNYHDATGYLSILCWMLVPSYALAVVSEIIIVTELEKKYKIVVALITTLTVIFSIIIVLNFRFETLLILKVVMETLLAISAIFLTMIMLKKSR